MKTIADFKRKMIKGAKVKTLLYWPDGFGLLQLSKDFGTRTVTTVHNGGFILTGTEKEIVYHWPTKKRFAVVHSNEAEIKYGMGKLVFTFE